MSQLILKGSIFDGEDFLEDGVVVVDQEQGIISEVGREGDIDIPKGVKVLYRRGQTILPGLIDCHVHFFGSSRHELTDWVLTPETLVALRSVADLRKLLAAGFTTVQEMGGKGATHISKAVREGAIQGPTVLTCGRSIGETGGDDDPIDLPLHIAKELSYSYYCDGPWECRRAVRMVSREGADFVKVYAATGSTPKAARDRVRLHPQLTVEELKAIVQESHSKGMRVAAHAIGEDSLQNVIEAGVDSIEHGIALTEELAERIRKKGIFYVPTLSYFLESRSDILRAETAPDSFFIRRHLKSDMKIAKDHGLLVVSGSDFAGDALTPHGENCKEIIALAKFLGNREALIAATSRAAASIGRENLGRVKRGFVADLTLVNGNPLKDIGVLSPNNILNVIKQGKPLNRSSA